MEKDWVGSTEQSAIEDHGIIGNMRSAALVALDGTIDFFCFPRFDSPSVCAALLHGEAGGFFSITPELENVRHKQVYLPDTNILLTRYLSEDAILEVTDCMPVEDGREESAYANQILRRIRVYKGEIKIRVRCAPRFDYARRTHRAISQGSGICFHVEGEECPGMALHATVPLHADGSDAVAEFTLKQGESAAFAFGAVAKDETAAANLLDAERVEEALQDSTEYWRKWIGHSTYKGRWREQVQRSALVLKLLSSQKEGALLAAATFGLPEEAGGSRNWDYRYTWSRDASFSLYALVRLGLSSEVRNFGRWLRNRVVTGFEGDGDGPLRVLYRIDGETELSEETLDHFVGYGGARPVRIGNGAQDQLQLDVYGEVMDAIYLANKYGPGMSKDGWRNVIRMMEWLRDNWERPDEGIWEVRSGRKHLLHSRLMCWVAFDRAIRLADKRSFDAPLHEWYETRRKIDEDIWQNFWSEEHQSFVYAKGEDAVDAALLLMPMLRYISPTDPRWLGTMDRIEKDLTLDNLVFRYRGDDGLAGADGGFTPCSFWFVECLARAGQVEKAYLFLEKMLGHANHLGLYSEELCSNGDLLGNFPQALTHLALISAATYLDRALDGTKEAWA